MSNPSPHPIRVGARTHAGMVRGENQDAMGRFQTPFGELIIVADGMGGHKGGALAAAMTIDGFDADLQSAPPWSAPAAALRRAAERVNAEIFRAANSGDEGVAGMGSTVVMLLLSGDAALVAHAGDSRAYLFRGGTLRRLTRDHSIVQEMVDAGVLTDEEARKHPDANVITRAMGKAYTSELEINGPLGLRDGDGILLCSDGLCGYLSDAEIEIVVSDVSGAQEITDALVALALDAGGDDNVTVQFIQYGDRR